MTPGSSHPPLVSVIIPVYDGARHLGAALDSVVAQDYRPLEIIVVDDGSNDGSGEIAGRYPDVRCLCQEHRGVSAARNAGVSAATGRLLAFLDADDLWLPTKLTRQVECFASRPEIEYCFTLHRWFLDPGVSRPSWTKPEQFDQDNVAYVPSSMMLRAETMARVGGFDPSRTIGEDSDWFFRARDLGVAMAVVPEVLLLKRVHTANLTGQVSRSQRELLDIVHRSIQRRGGRATPPASRETTDGS